jgi:GTP diphosphokinase / guanosine-3',5'-bis(diphosphate) 3'-diphosphatase
MAFAERSHAGQQLADGAPFILHPLEVGWLLYRSGAPDDLIAAGVLHDVLEKSDVSSDALRVRFGATITALVNSVTEDEHLRGYRVRKAALRQQVAVAGSQALMIFAADKVSKVRELRAAVSASARRGDHVGQSLVPPRRLEHFRNCLVMLEERLGETPLVAEFRKELLEFEHELRSAVELPRAV